MFGKIDPTESLDFLDDRYPNCVDCGRKRTEHETGWTLYVMGDDPDDRKQWEHVCGTCRMIRKDKEKK